MQLSPSSIHRTFQKHQLFFFPHTHNFQGFPDSSIGKESACNAGNIGSIPGSGRSAREGIGYPLQYSWASSLVAQLVKNAADLSLIPGLGRSPGEGKGYPLQCSGLADFMHCLVHGVADSRTGLRDFHFQDLQDLSSLTRD